MLSARYFDTNGEAGEDRELPVDPFDGVVHETAIYQAVKAQLANRRQGTAATKTRGMVAGGGRKIWRQKGTGRARQGSIRAPHWRGGGVVFGPSPRSYRESLPKKVRQLARRSAFNVRAQEGAVVIIEGFDFEAPSTRQMRDLLDRVGIADQKVLVLTTEPLALVQLSARNLPNVRVLPYAEASTYDLLNADQLLIEAGALETNGQEVSDA
jgi:large subunit ribosomal protein L4